MYKGVRELTDNKIAFVRGDSYAVLLTLYFAEDDKPYMLEDGDTVRFVVLDCGGNAVITKILGIQDQQEDGCIRIEFLPRETQDITERYLFYEVELEFAHGDIATPLSDEFTLFEDNITPQIRADRA